MKRWCLVMLGAIPLSAAPLPAQTTAPIGRQPAARPPADAPSSRWQGEVVTAAVNAALGAVTAGAFTAARRIGRDEPGERRPGWRDVRRAILGGAAGGTVIYAGKRIAGEGFDGSGLLGRQIASVGASVVHNAGAPPAAATQLVLPFGPVRLYAERAPRAAESTRAPRRWGWRAKLDGGALVGTLIAATETGARFDAARSLSAGAPVFVTSQARLLDACNAGDIEACRLVWGPERQGYAAGGAVWLFEPSVQYAGRTTMRALLAHEQVHVIQYDAGVTQWSVPAEGWLLSHVPGGRWLHQRVDLGLSALVTDFVGSHIAYERRPWEREAYFLSRTRSDGYMRPLASRTRAALDALSAQP